MFEMDRTAAFFPFFHHLSNREQLRNQISENLFSNVTVALKVQNCFRNP
jgi:hypothetical protein